MRVHRPKPRPTSQPVDESAACAQLASKAPKCRWHMVIRDGPLPGVTTGTAIRHAGLAMHPRDTTRRSIPAYAVLGTAGALTGALAYIGLRDPHASSFGFPACPFRMLTGWNCPGCGGLRMTHDVLHGDLAAAVVDNVFMLVWLPMLALWLIM